MSGHMRLGRYWLTFPNNGLERIAGRNLSELS